MDINDSGEPISKILSVWADVYFNTANQSSGSGGLDGNIIAIHKDDGYAKSVSIIDSIDKFKASRKHLLRVHFSRPMAEFHLSAVKRDINLTNSSDVGMVDILIHNPVFVGAPTYTVTKGSLGDIVRNGTICSEIDETISEGDVSDFDVYLSAKNGFPPGAVLKFRVSRLNDNDHKNFDIDMWLC